MKWFKKDNSKQLGKNNKTGFLREYDAEEYMAAGVKVMNGSYLFNGTKINKSQANNLVSYHKYTGAVANSLEQAEEFLKDRK